MRALVFLVAVLLSSVVLAGDYELYIWNIDKAECSAHLPAGPCNQSSRQSCSAADVSEDLRSYFAGDEPKIRALLGSFGNGHLVFCSAEAKATISRTLRELKTNKRGRHLSDFITVNRL